MQGPLLLRAAWVVPQAGVPPLRDAAVLITNGRIAAVGPNLPAPEGADVIDLGAAVLMPGLVNAHQHGRGISQLAMGYPDRPLEPWIAARLQHGPPDIHAVTRLAAEAMLANGVTATLHANYSYGSGDYAAELRAQIAAYRAAGLRATVCVGVQDRGVPVYPDADAAAFIAGLPDDARALVTGPAPAPYMADWDASVALMDALHAETADDPAQTLAWGPAGPQWVSDTLWAQVAADAARRGVGVHFHLLESPAQAAAARRLYPEGTLARLRTCGVFAARTSCAHGVHMTPADMDIALAEGLAVVLNPGSNMRLFNGPPPVADLRRAGVRLAVGTDNCALADDEDLLREMRLAALLGRADGAIPAGDEAASLLHMATAGGAAAAFLPEDHGVIAPGAPADLAAFATDRIGIDTQTDPARLVERLLAQGSGRDCVLTVVAGAIRYAARPEDRARLAHWQALASASVAARAARAPAAAVAELQTALSTHYAVHAGRHPVAALRDAGGYFHMPSLPKPVSLGERAAMDDTSRATAEQEHDMIERIDTGQRMSKIVKHGGVAYLCGQVGEGATVAEQTRDCLSRVDALLTKAGSSRDRMLQAVIWLADMADFAEMNAVWDAWVPEGHAPARACGEAKLARPELRVEIIVTAAC